MTDIASKRVVALHAPRPTLDLTAYEPRNVEEGMAVAQMIARSGLLGQIPPRPETVFFLMARGRELGFSMAQSLYAFDIIGGVPTLKAQAMVALCQKRNEVCRYLRCTETTEQQATWETWREGEPEPQRRTYTMQDAARMKLTGKDNWQKQPRTMLRWRAASQVCREVYGDITLGLYSTEELQDIRDTVDMPPRMPSITAPEPLPEPDPPQGPPTTEYATHGLPDPASLAVALMEASDRSKILGTLRFSTRTHGALNAANLETLLRGIAEEHYAQLAEHLGFEVDDGSPVDLGIASNVVGDVPLIDPSLDQTPIPFEP